MTTTTNGQVRKTLATQLDRLDSILDGLSDGLNEAVATAVQQAVATAVQQAVVEVMTNAELERLLHPSAPQPPTPPYPTPPRSRGRQAGGWAGCGRPYAALPAGLPRRPRGWRVAPGGGGPHGSPDR